MEILTAEYNLTGLDRINVILGKNGCGKSTMLKRVSQLLVESAEWTRRKYVTPERGGQLSFDQNVEANARNSGSTWQNDVRLVNQFTQFRQLSVYEFDTMQMSILRNYKNDSEAGRTPSNVDSIGMINSLLDNIEIREIPESRGFKIHHKVSGDELPPSEISSGESELISLGIECLSFALVSPAEGKSMLILDEPDVHLHPDLQARLMQFLNQLVDEYPWLHVLMATHSTAILGALASFPHTTVAPMVSGQTNLEFEGIDEAYRRVLPVFGAHPLSAVFKEVPVLLVEGTDEDRIWQQAVRTSTGKISFYPVDVGGLSFMPAYEDRVVKIATSVYDNAPAYSVRDRDDSQGQLEDFPPLIRSKLGCRASENLLLSEEVLSRLGVTWDEVQSRCVTWAEAHPDHQATASMLAFIAEGFDRKNFDLKKLRMILVADILESDKPWEVIVGQTIGMLTATQLASAEADSISDYLGEKFARVVSQMVAAHS
jgi:predicted ATPase